MSNPWFRLYTDILNDEKILSISPSDRWLYVAVLCLKGEGVLDKYEGKELERKVALKVRLSALELTEHKRRLVEEELITEDWQPVAWAERQFTSDSSADRTRKWRENKKKSDARRKRDVTVTVQDTDTDTEPDTEKSNMPLFEGQVDPFQSPINEMEREFKAWWDNEYPERHGQNSRKKAWECYCKHRKTVTKEAIWAATLAYFNQLLEDETPPKFVKMATSFLNSEPWND